MIPKSLSASSLSVAEKCMARWKTEYFDRVRGPGGSAADLGTTCHAALEQYVKLCYLADEPMPAEWAILEAAYRNAFPRNFGHDLSVPEFADGLAMLSDWFKRTDFEDREILSTERKENFLIPTSAGKIPFNFIMDRLDKIGPDEYEVVDYKSQRFPVAAEELKGRLQARVYAMATQMKYPSAKKIWVTFDLLRHDPVSVAFSIEENRNTYLYLKRLAQAIVSTDEKDVKETINSECRFCVRKASCKTLQSNIAGGGISSLTDIADLVDMLDTLNNQQNAISQLQAQIEEGILVYAAEHEILSWDENGKRVDIIQKSRRTVRDEDAVKALLPPAVLTKYGSVGVTVIDKIIKDKEVDAETVKALRAQVVNRQGALGVVVKSY